MTFYILDKDGNNILFYKYYANDEKIYRYKKTEMERQGSNIIGALFYLKYDIIHFNDEDIYINDNQIDTYAHHIEYIDSNINSFRKCELLEAYYNDNIDIGLKEWIVKDYKYMGAYAVFQKKILIRPETKIFLKNRFVTNEVFRVPESLIILDQIKNGIFKYDKRKDNMITKALTCFDFDTDYYEKISIDSLKLLYGNNTIDIINNARENKRILNLKKWY